MQIVEIRPIAVISRIQACQHADIQQGLHIGCLRFQNSREFLEIYSLK